MNILLTKSQQSVNVHVEETKLTLKQHNSIYVPAISFKAEVLDKNIDLQIDQDERVDIPCLGLKNKILTFDNGWFILYNDVIKSENEEEKMSIDVHISPDRSYVEPVLIKKVTVDQQLPLPGEYVVGALNLKGYAAVESCIPDHEGNFIYKLRIMQNV